MIKIVSINVDCILSVSGGYFSKIFFFKFDKIQEAFAVVGELTNYPPETAAKFITKSRSLKLAR
jgi:hypothetical protein